MSTANQLTSSPWFWQHRAARLPYQVIDALTNNEISVLQFCILVILHHRADWETGIILSFSAEQVIYELGGSGLIPEGTKKVRQRFVQRDMKSLREHGWYHWDYKEGSHRPYTIWLHNYAPTYYKMFTSASASNIPIVADEYSEFVADGQLLNPSIITSCGKHHVKYVADENDRNVADGDAEMSPNNAEQDSAFGGEPAASPVSPKANPLPPPAVEAPRKPLPQRESPPSAVVSVLSSRDTELRDENQTQDAFGGGQEKQSLSLRQTLSKIAAQRLHITSGVPANWEFKCGLFAEAYGADAVVQDFEAWCGEPHGTANKPFYVQYSGVIDARLGKAALEPIISIYDARVQPIISTAYDLTGELAPAEAVARLLQTETPADILEALDEFIKGRDERTLKADVRQFWTLNGAQAVIRARKNRKEAAAAKPESARAVAEDITQIPADNGQLRVNFKFQCLLCGKQHSAHVITKHQHGTLCVHIALPCGVMDVLVRIPELIGVQS